MKKQTTENNKNNTLFTHGVVILFALVIRAVYHLRGNHTVTLYEKREKIRYHLRVWPLGLLSQLTQYLRYILPYQSPTVDFS